MPKYRTCASCKKSKLSERFVQDATAPGGVAKACTGCLAEEFMCQRKDVSRVLKAHNAMRNAEWVAKAPKTPGYSRRAKLFDAAQDPVSEACALESMTRYCIAKLKVKKRSARQLARAFLDHEKSTSVALVDPLTKRRLPVHQFMYHTEIGLQDAIRKLGLVYQ